MHCASARLPSTLLCYTFSRLSSEVLWRVGGGAPGTQGSSQQAAPPWAHSHTEQLGSHASSAWARPGFSRQRRGCPLPRKETGAWAVGRVRRSTMMVEWMDVAPGPPAAHAGQGEGSGKGSIAVWGPSATKPVGNGFSIPWVIGDTKK